MRKPAFCICKNKDVDQPHSNCPAEKRICFPYMDSTVPILSRSEISSSSIRAALALMTSLRWPPWLQDGRHDLGRVDLGGPSTPDDLE